MISSRIYIISCLLVMLPIHMMANLKSEDPGSELQMYKSKYPDHSFIRLFHKKDVLIEPDESGKPVMKFKEEQVEMILSESAAGLSESKEYFNGKTEIKKFEAYSLVPSGKGYKKIAVSKIDKSSEFDDGLYYDDSWCYSFNFPATGVGVKRCTSSEFEIKDPYYTLQYFFSGNIPTEHSELTVTMPENIKINFHLFAIDTLSVQKSQSKKGRFITYKWISQQPKVYEKDFMAPDIRYFRPHLVVNIASYINKADTMRYIGTMTDLYKWMEQKYGNVNRINSPEIKQLTDSITKDLTNPSEKVRAIYKWVQNNIKYIAIEDGENGFVPREASQVLKRRYGDCKDKSGLMTSMILASGEMASIAIVGTRELPYKFSVFPSIICANHVVTIWWNNNKPFVLDGTSHHQMLEDVPAFIQGKEYLTRMSEGNYKLLKIPVAEASNDSQIDTIHIDFDKDLLTGTGKTEITGELKTIVINHMEKEEKEKQMKYWPFVIARASDKMIVKDISTSDLNNSDKPLMVNYTFHLPDYITRVDSIVYLNINIERELNDLDIKDDRALPIEVEFTKDHQVVYSIKVPDNMQVKYIPSSVTFNNPLFGFSHDYSQKGNEIFMHSKLYLNTLLIEGKNIREFKGMVENLKKAYRQSIILTKK